MVLPVRAQWEFLLRLPAHSCCVLFPTNDEVALVADRAEWVKRRHDVHAAQMTQMRASDARASVAPSVTSVVDWPVASAITVPHSPAAKPTAPME